MACVTQIRNARMIGNLTGGSNAIVTTDASTDHFVVINRRLGYRCPG